MKQELIDKIYFIEKEKYIRTIEDSLTSIFENGNFDKYTDCKVYVGMDTINIAVGIYCNGQTICEIIVETIPYDRLYGEPLITTSRAINGFDENFIIKTFEKKV